MVQVILYGEPVTLAYGLFTLDNEIRHGVFKLTNSGAQSFRPLAHSSQASDLPDLLQIIITENKDNEVQG